MFLGNVKQRGVPVADKVKVIEVKNKKGEVEKITFIGTRQEIQSLFSHGDYTIKTPKCPQLILKLDGNGINVYQNTLNNLINTVPFGTDRIPSEEVIEKCRVTIVHRIYAERIRPEDMKRAS